MTRRRWIIAAVVSVWLGVLALGWLTYPRWGYETGYHVFAWTSDYPPLEVAVARKRFSWLPGRPYRAEESLRLEGFAHGATGVELRVFADEGDLESVGGWHIHLDDLPPGAVIVDDPADG